MGIPDRGCSRILAIRVPVPPEWNPLAPGTEDPRRHPLPPAQPTHPEPQPVPPQRPVPPSHAPDPEKNGNRPGR